MHYVVLEAQTTHLVEKPKDQCRINKLSYQIIDAETLVPYYDAESLPIITLEEPDCISFQQAIEQFDKGIQSAIGADSEVVLCSLNSTWDVRVTIPRQAHDDGIVLPSYLQHPKIFDLWKEYERWCTNHPEVSSLRKNDGKRAKDLSEISKVLEVPEKFLNETANLEKTVQILLQLHKKCSNPDDNSMVLTLPYDSYSDTRNFLQEQSKVLYLNNLPPDTTQSELESWFTQFGARPIGFWTVKNIVEETSNVNNNWSMNNSPYVEEQDSISGFVVFQTHEEAMEVLMLNGRSILSNMANTKQPRVVEHIVEIQPSSTRVLDRAQAILSPFPQSKNKPRPGDWNCPSCGFSNFQRRTSCFRCSFPSTSSQTNNGKQYMNPNVNNAISSNNGTNNNNKTNLSPNQNQYAPNLNMQAQVGQQGQLSRSMTPSFGDSTIAMNQNHRYNSGGNINYNSGSNINNTSIGNSTNNNRFNPQLHGNSNCGSNIPFRAGDWKCPTCTYHNFAKNVVCLRCGGPKITSVNLENKLLNNNNNHNNNSTGIYNKSNMGGLMNMAAMGSTASLNEYSSNTKGNEHFTIGSNGMSSNGLGVSLDVRSSSEPKW